MQVPDEVLLFELLPRVPLKELAKLCQSDQRLRNLCQSEQLWENRVKYEFPIAYYTKTAYPGFSWKQLYFYLSESKLVPIYFNGDIIDHLRVYYNTMYNTLKEGSKFKQGTLILINEFGHPILLISYPGKKFEELSDDTKSIIKGIITNEPILESTTTTINSGRGRGRNPNPNPKDVSKKLPTIIFYALTSPNSSIPIYAIKDGFGRMRIVDNRKTDRRLINKGKICNFWRREELEELAKFLQLPVDTNNLCETITNYLISINHYHMILF